MRNVSPPTQPVGISKVDSGLRRRQQRRQRGRGGGSRAWLGWLVVAFVGVVIVGLIAMPFLYRSLPGEWRSRITHRLPFMSAFEPQREYTADSLPTVAPSTGDGPSAADLLLAPVTSPTPESTAVDLTGIQATPNEDGVIIITNTPTQAPTVQPTDAPTLTAQPTQAQPTPTWTPMPPPTLAATAVAMLPSARLYGFEHIYQEWNNCGPATLTMALSYYGWTEHQNVAASYLKPDREDKNVSPGQMVRFVNEQTGVNALVRMGGDLDMIRRLVAAGFPVIVETGYMPEGYDWMGHYRLIVAYDDALRQVYVYDSFLGHGDYQGLTVSYDLFDNRWQDFNRTYIVIYDDASTATLNNILGQHVDPAYNAQHALEVAQQEASADPSNPFAWFNVGTSYLELGLYEEAAQAYDLARNAGTGLPWRMLWYQFGPFEAYFNVGRYDDVLALVQANLGTTPYVEETYYWTGMVYMARGQYAPARGQFTLALQHNRNFLPAQDALVQLDVAEANNN